MTVDLRIPGLPAKRGADIIVVDQISVITLDDLPLIADAGGGAGFLPCRVQRGKEHGGQYRDDRNHDEELDQCENPAFVSSETIWRVEKILSHDRGPFCIIFPGIPEKTVCCFLFIIVYFSEIRRAEMIKNLTVLTNELL